MITRIEARNFRCLKSISQTLRPFQVLVGPNSSGKSAFLDVIGFISDLVNVGLKQAVANRTDNFHDLVWGRTGTSFELAIDAELPPNQIRYSVTVRLNVSTDQVEIAAEQLAAIDEQGKARSVFIRTDQRTDFQNGGHNGSPGLYVSPDVSSVLYIEDPTNPSAGRLKSLMQSGVQLVDLNNDRLGGASPPGKGQLRVFDGQNLARTVLQVSESSPEAYEAWLRHIRTALPDIESIRTVLRPEDRHRYLMVRYNNGIEVPAWMLSSGTLRLLALTILAYIPDFNGVYLIEEPEIGLHPTAIEAIVQSLSSVYNGQVLLTSHSPLLLGLAEPRDLLCFQRNEQGTEIIPGDQHKMLQDWRSGVNISELFAAGVLG